jgi:hypothetical protein
MSNLLRKQMKSNLTWMYAVRMVVVFVGMGFVALFVSFVASLPVAVYSNILYTNHASKQAGQNIDGVSKKRQALTAELKINNLLLERIDMVSKMPKIDSILKSTISILKQVDDISLDDISVIKDSNNNLYKVQISGTAKSRNGIVSVRDTFEESKLFRVTNFPISNFTPNMDEYGFFIEVTMK